MPIRGMQISDNRSDLCTHLAWDSEFWGFPIGRVNSSRLTPESLTRILEWSERSKVQCLYFSADGADIQTLSLANGGGFRYVDTRVELEKKLISVPISNFEVSNIRSAIPADLPALKDIAKNSFEDSRFYKDSNFDSTLASVLYEKWIERDFRENEILVHTENEDNVTPVGFVSCSVSSVNEGRIGLIAVHPLRRGRGIAGSLLRAAENYFHKKTASRALVATQASNIAALRLYEASGFRIHETRIWFHRWSIV